MRNWQSKDRPQNRKMPKRCSLCLRVSVVNLLCLYTFAAHVLTS